MIKNFGVKTKKLLKIAMFLNTLLIFFALSLCVSLAWYKGDMSASGTLVFDSHMIMEYSGFDSENVEKQWPASVNVKLVESTDLSSGAKQYVSAASINKKNQAGVNDFYIRAKLNYEVFTSTANNAQPVSSATLESENFEIEDMLNIFGVFDYRWFRCEDGWFYYSTNGTSLATLPTSAVNMFVENAHYEVYEDSYSTNASGSTFKVSNDLTIAKYKVYLTLNLLDSSRAPANEGWNFAEDKAGISSEYLASHKICAQGETTAISASSLTDATNYDVLDASNKGFRVLVDGSNLTVTAPVGSPTDVEIPKYLVVGENVYTITSLTSGSFNWCTSLKNIKLPSSITSIAVGSFAGTLNLDEFVASGTYSTLDRGNLLITGTQAFSIARSGITSYTIPNTITAILRQAFSR